MAFTNLYIQSGGNSMNAGSSTANAADVTSTNGSWDITADTFIATAATPFSAVTTNDWVSIYADGTTTGVVYSAQVVSINSGGLSVTLSTTAKYGTKPSASATARSAKVNGAWADETALVQLGATTIPAATKVNWKQATYTLTTNRTIALAGTTLLPLWISGYNTTPGDLDNDTTNSLTKPALSLNSTFQLSTTGAYQIWSSFNVTGTRTGTIWQMSGAGSVTLRCRSENTSANAGAIAFTPATATQLVAYCWFKCPTTATTTGAVSVAIGSTLIGCVAEGGGLAGFNGAATSSLYINCIGYLNTGAGFLASTGGARLFNCTVYGATVDGVKWSGTPPTSSAVVGCLFAGVSGGAAITNGINNASGANTGNMFRSCNDYYNVTNSEVGFGDSPAWFGQTDSAFPLTGATDMTPITGSNALTHGFPGIFENESYSSYVSNGAVTPSGAGVYPSAVFIFGG